MTFPNPRVIPAAAGVPEVEQEQRPFVHALGDLGGGGRTLCGLDPLAEKLAGTVFPGLVSCEACLLTLAPDSVGEVEERTDKPEARRVIASEYREFLFQEGAEDRADDFADWIVEHLFSAGFVIRTVGDSGGTAALRADVVTSAPSGLVIADLVLVRGALSRLPDEPSARAAFDRIDRLVRGEQQ